METVMVVSANTVATNTVMMGQFYDIRARSQYTLVMVSLDRLRDDLAHLPGVSPRVQQMVTTMIKSWSE